MRSAGTCVRTATDVTCVKTQGVRDAKKGGPLPSGLVSPEPSKSKAKKSKKKNLRLHRAQNKDAMTQLRDAFPEHMRPPEHQGSTSPPVIPCHAQH